MMHGRRAGRGFAPLVMMLGLPALIAVGAPAAAQITPFMQSVAEALLGESQADPGSDSDLPAFYRDAGYADLWTGADDAPRRAALFTALSDAPFHGLSPTRHDPGLMRDTLARVRTERDRGAAEVALSRMYLAYARDVQSGVLTPARAHPDIKREAPRRSDAALLRAIAGSGAGAEASAGADAAMRALPPATQEYRQLVKHKARLEQVVATNGWGAPVPLRDIAPGDSGADVVALRDRLIRMEYLDTRATAAFDDAMVAAIRSFQADHGLLVDGVPGPATLGEVNVPAADRLASLMVALERTRWLNLPGGLGARHVWVNLTDFRTQIVDDGKITFETKSVVGDRVDDKETPEFSETMEYMEINPDWTVPRSILGRDYLPKLQANPGAASYLELIDQQGRVVPRQNVNFSQYTERNFPFTLRQPPGDRNALGTVKFMFPNPYAIYLHDTPDQHLFGREVRTFSSGCVRLNDPHDFAYALLARQTDDPRGTFDPILASRKQTRLSLETPIPVHIVYRTAFIDPRGRLQFRRDIYGRDAAIWDALRQSGVAPADVQG